MKTKAVSISMSRLEAMAAIAVFAVLVTFGTLRSANAIESKTSCGADNTENVAPKVGIGEKDNSKQISVSESPKSPVK